DDSELQVFPGFAAEYGPITSDDPEVQVFPGFAAECEPVTADDSELQVFPGFAAECGPITSDDPEVQVFPGFAAECEPVTSDDPEVPAVLESVLGVFTIHKHGYGDVSKLKDISGPTQCPMKQYPLPAESTTDTQNTVRSLLKNGVVHKHQKFKSKLI
ncbi:hypothetical protein scyTo_0026449, partial [Scyliorhinus torazame]|nr:hypothetical protein [Scyliorhinus torazame]